MKTVNYNICGKEDLKDYSNNELNLRVFNDESLYNVRHNRQELMEILKKLFYFTNEQKSELIDNLNEYEAN